LAVKEVRSDHRLSNGGEADRLTALRNPSESYRDVILRLLEAGDEGAGSKNRRLSERISNSTMAQSIAVSTTKNRMFLMRSIALMIAPRAPAVSATRFATTKRLAGAGQIGLGPDALRFPPRN
jgi:hypothetical protein